MSLADGDDAETVDAFSEDSCSTLSSAHEESTATSAAEARLRRDVVHAAASIPELQPQLTAAEAARTPPGVHPHAAALVSAAGAPHADHIEVAVRWRVSLSTDRGATSHVTQWLPYAPPRPALPAAPVLPVDATHTETSGSSTSGGGSCGATARAAHSAGSWQLTIGRGTLLRAATLSPATPADEHSDAAREALVSAAASVSRVQCVLHLHYSTSTAARPSCRSVDIFAIAPTTALRGVALQPHQRYHLKRRSGAAALPHHAAATDQPCDADGVLALRVGPHCHVDVALDGVPREPRGGRGDVHGAPAPPHGETLDSPALYRTAARQSKEAPRERHAAAAAAAAAPPAMQLRRGSTASLVGGDSTVVLATLSAASEPVALSDVSDGEADVAATQSSSDGSAAPPRVPRRRPSATAGARPSTASAQVRAAEDTVPADVLDVAAPKGMVLYTTGLRLSAAEEATLQEIGALVNPNLRLARHARVLVVQRPLIRSVKLLTALPYVQDVVHQSWLDAVLHTRTLDLPIEGFAYRERRIAGSIESENSFDLRKLLSTAPVQRQRLFAGLRLWIHAAAQPQEPPMNDLKLVVAASGGTITRRAIDADVLVLPQQKPSLACWRGIAQQLSGGGGSRGAGASAAAEAALAQRRHAGALFVVPDDIFKCVLQQRRPTASSVALPRQLATPASATRSSGRASQPPRKTTRPSSTPRTPRPSAAKQKR